MRGGLQFSTAAYTGALAVNFTDGYTDNFAVATDGDIDSWLTVDASFSVQLDKLIKSGWAGDSDLTLSVSNLLDEHPPIVELVPLRFFPYDPANSDPAGRRISLYWTMRW